MEADEAVLASAQAIRGVNIALSVSEVLFVSLCSG